MAIALIVIGYLLILNPAIKQGQTNVENSKSLVLGMSKEEVLKVMGPPDSISEETTQEGATETYYYQPPPFSSDGIFVEFDQHEQATKIVYYE